MSAALPALSIVVIGRNEGPRLARCLDSLPGGVEVVYADSASTDGSPELARERGAEVSPSSPRDPRPRSAAMRTGARRALLSSCSWTVTPCSIPISRPRLIAIAKQRLGRLTGHAA